jgi:phosphotransferase system  glucose/maltose/N-acetylglucosamine-specific IIC component
LKDNRSLLWVPGETLMLWLPVLIAVGLAAYSSATSGLNGMIHILYAALLPSL